MAHHPSVHAHDLAAVSCKLRALSAVRRGCMRVLIALMLDPSFFAGR